MHPCGRRGVTLDKGSSAICHGHTERGLGRSTDDGATGYGLRATGYELGARSGEARNSRSCEQHEIMKTEMTNETRWNETRILD